MTDLGRTHWKLNYLRDDETGERVYAVIAPTIGMDAIIDRETNKLIDAEPKPEDWRDVKLMEGSFQECLDWLQAIHDL